MGFSIEPVPFSMRLSLKWKDDMLIMANVRKVVFCYLHKLGILALLAVVLSACSTTPGPSAASTIPLDSHYVVLNQMETYSSCGVSLLFLPITNPVSLSELIERSVALLGGNGIVQVSSQSRFGSFLIGQVNCIEVMGIVVRVG